MKNTFRLKTAALAALGLVASIASESVLAVDFDGYFRAGPGATTAKNASRACYNLSGVSIGHYRLGNECDFYGEFGLSQSGQVDNVDFKAKVMFNEFNPGTDTGTSASSFAQMYVEGKGFDMAPGTNFWIGKRYYGRRDVHIADAFITQLDGVGGGAEIPVADMKLGLSFFNSDGTAGSNALTNPGNRLNFDLSNIGFNDGGKVRALLTFTNGNFSASAPGVNGAGTSGTALSLQHDQEIKSLGGSNTAWLQWAQGSAGLNGNFGTMTAPTEVQQVRLVDALTWQVGALGGQGLFEIGQHGADSVNGTPKYSEISTGGRLSYAFTKNFKMLFEAGYMQKTPDGGPTQSLTKFTIAPTLSTGSGFWNRPELRFYVTQATWNDAANAAAGPKGLMGLGDGSTNGTSYGLQAEVWF